VSTTLGLYNYWIVIFLMMTGFFIVISRNNLVKKIIGLNIFQTSVFLLFITIGKVRGGTAPILPLHTEPGHDPTVPPEPFMAYSNPLPSVLILTAIVVGVATTALALSIIVRIKEEYGTVEDDEIEQLDRPA
jgi:multicomponent Na+:H+ antiporter subunit C